MKDNCPLGFECVIDESVPLYRRDCCANWHTCNIWTAPWELPYWRDCDKLLVDFVEVYNSNLRDEFSENPITARYDWREYFAEYGFAEAVDLPYDFEPNIIVVSIADDHPCREEMKKVGYANAVGLPLQERITFENLAYQEVDLYWCDNEAFNALNAGYADAIYLLSLQCENNSILCAAGRTFEI